MRVCEDPSVSFQVPKEIPQQERIIFVYYADRASIGGCRNRKCCVTKKGFTRAVHSSAMGKDRAAAKGRG
jgi:hypothetical protein